MIIGENGRNCGDILIVKYENDSPGIGANMDADSAFSMFQRIEDVNEHFFKISFELDNASVDVGVRKDEPEVRVFSHTDSSEEAGYVFAVDGNISMGYLNDSHIWMGRPKEDIKSEKIRLRD